MRTSVGRDADSRRAACTNHFFGAPSIFLGQAWADGKGKLATCRHRAASSGETVQNVRCNSLDRLHASMIKQKKKQCI